MEISALSTVMVQFISMKAEAEHAVHLLQQISTVVQT